MLDRDNELIAFNPADEEARAAKIIRLREELTNPQTDTALRTHLNTQMLVYFKANTAVATSFTQLDDHVAALRKFLGNVRDDLAPDMKEYLDHWSAELDDYIAHYHKSYERVSEAVTVLPPMFDSWHHALKDAIGRVEAHRQTELTALHTELETNYKMAKEKLLAARKINDEVIDNAQNKYVNERRAKDAELQRRETALAVDKIEWNFIERKKRKVIHFRYVFIIIVLIIVIAGLSPPTV